MVTEERVGTAVGAHLVGGLQAADAETAMRTAAGILGRHLHAITDGETGDRSQWIFWQIGKLTAIDGIEPAGTQSLGGGENPDYSEFPALTVAASLTELPPRTLGYADAAASSYATFLALRNQGVIPPGVKFQVSIPTPYAVVASWILEADRRRFFPVYSAAIRDEVGAIVRAVDPADLLVQYDVAVEIGVLSGAFRVPGELADKAFVAGALHDVVAATPLGVERGVHLCYGDFRHRHFATPRDLSLCVELANAVSDTADFVHMPADRDAARDPAYFEPLRELDARRLALGVVDYEGDPLRTAQLAQAATVGSGGIEFAVATECGMSRIDERGPGGPSLERLLELHATTARPIR